MVETCVTYQITSTDDKKQIDVHSRYSFSETEKQVTDPITNPVLQCVVYK